MKTLLALVLTLSAALWPETIHAQLQMPKRASQGEADSATNNTSFLTPLTGHRAGNFRIFATNSYTGGHPGNRIFSGDANIIAGGGRTTVDGYTNVIGAGNDNTISGGAGNTIGLNDASGNIIGNTIGGGELNDIGIGSILGCFYNTIAGGEVSSIGDDTYDNFIGGGKGNAILDSSIASVIAGGGQGNGLLDASDEGNIVSNSFSGVLGGVHNRAGAEGVMIAGNRITEVNPYAFAAGYSTRAMTVRSNGATHIRGVIFEYTNAVSEWPTAAPVGGASCIVNSNSFLYRLKSAPNSTAWVSTNIVN